MFSEKYTENSHRPDSDDRLSKIHERKIVGFLCCINPEKNVSELSVNRTQNVFLLAYFLYNLQLNLELNDLFLNKVY